MSGLKKCDVEGGVESSDLMQLRYLIELISGTTRISESRFDPTDHPKWVTIRVCGNVISVLETCTVKNVIQASSRHGHGRDEAPLERLCWKKIRNKAK